MNFLFAIATSVTRAFLVMEFFLRALAPFWGVVVSLLLLSFFASDGEIGILSKRWFLFIAITSLTLALIFSIPRLILSKWLWSKERARSQLERYFSLAHAPLRTLKDKPMTTGDVMHDTTWLHHQKNARQRLSLVTFSHFLKITLKYSQKKFIPLCLVMVGFWGLIAIAPSILGRDWHPAPLLHDGAWRIVPPAYTHQLPLALDLNSRSSAVIFPENSVLYVKTQASWQKPSLRLQKKTSRQGFVPFLGDKETGYEAAIPLALDARQLYFFQEGRAWHIALAPVRDKKPSAHLSSSAEPSGYIHPLPYAALDDYGITQADLIFQHENGMSDMFSLKSSLNNGKSKTIQGSFKRDLTAHPFAGEETTIQLQAEDGYGHKAVSDMIETVLPERIFHNEHARAIIAWRKQWLLQKNADIQILHKLSREIEHEKAQALIVQALSFSSEKKTGNALWQAALLLDGQIMAALLQQLQDRLENWDGENKEAMKQLEKTLGKLSQNLPPSEEETKRDLDISRQLLEQGHEEQAQKTLSDLMEQLNERQAERDFAEAQRRHHEQLKDILNQQKELLAETQEKSQDPMELAERQKELQQHLEQLSPQQNQKQNHEQTAQSMKQAEESLRGQQLDDAQSHQEDAIISLLKNLKQGSQQQATTQNNSPSKSLKGLGQGNRSSWNKNDDISLLQKKEMNEQSRILSQLRSQLEQSDLSSDAHSYFKNLLSIF